jgi:hypothetical protein
MEVTKTTRFRPQRTIVLQSKGASETEVTYTVNEMREVWGDELGLPTYPRS